MRKPTPRRTAVARVALTLVTFSIGLMLAVFVAGSASAKTSPKKVSSKKTTTSQVAPSTTTTVAPADKFSVINGTVNAASDHEIVGSSAFPNYTTGAVDNYYSMAHSHLDNSPFAEGTASPADTGPVGQTAAAGNFQQPQYADGRWPGGPDKATYGSQGGPYAEAAADNNRATADASEASNGLSGPGPEGTKTLAVPIGFDNRLQQALAAWNSTWSGRLGMKKATPPKATTPVPSVTVPSSQIKPPVVTTPDTPVTPPVTVPSPNLPSAGAMGATRSPASFSVPRPATSLPSLPSKASASPSGGTESLLSSSTLATLVYQTDKSKLDTSANNTCKSDLTGTTGTTTTDTTTTDTPKSGTCSLVLTGESSMGRVTLGGGQIVIEGIHVTASITNDGTTPSYNAAVSVASASIGGIPVTIDQNGVHVAGQGQGLPYQQASTALNSALNKAGIQIFLVQPEVTTCGQTGMGTGGGTTTTTTATTSTSPDQSGATSSCGQTGMDTSCNASGTGTGTGGGSGLPAPPTPTTTQSSTTTTPSSCGQSDMGASCDQTGSGTDGGTSYGPGTTTTTTSPAPTSTGSQSSTTTTPSSCDQSGMPAPTSSCSQAGPPTGTTTASNDQSSTTTTTPSNSAFQFGPDAGTNNAGEETVTATGVHIVFTQPVNQSGVPAQYVEHILGEVFVDSLATPAAPLGPLPNLGLNGSSVYSSCLGSRHSGSKTSASGFTAGGSSSIGGSGSSGSGAGSLSASGSSLGSSSQPSTTSSVPASFARALRKPLWLLLAYLVWQVMVVGTGWSLWNWRRDGAS